MTLIAGSRLGRYEVRTHIGAGGMGEVYLAWDRELERQVALKVLPPDIVGDTTRLERFIREAKAASALNHPNIVTVYDVGQSEAARFIVTEYVDGETIRALIAGGALDVPQALDITMQVTSALAEAHRAGIVHRDIKPENVMLRPSGIVKLLDFGLAKVTYSGAVPDADGPTLTQSPSPTAAGVIVGTYGYMAPEQLRGSHVDTRADLFSLGVMLYELVSGRRPFGGATGSDLLASILRDDPTSLGRHVPNVPPELERIVTKLLEKAPDNRYQTAGDLLVDLKRLHRSLEAPVAPRKWPTSWAPLSIGIAALGLGIAAYLFWQRTDSSEPATPLTVRPLTSYPSIERSVAFSPDGRQVAFAWVGGGAPNFDIYVQLIDAGAPLRLTTSPARDMSPAWSPDGRYVAFLRGTGDDKGFYVVPALGGGERKVGTAYGWRQAGITPHAVAWIPDGDRLAVIDKETDADPWAIYLLSVESGQRRKLTTPPVASTGDLRVAVSPDGRRVAFARVTTATTLYTQAIDGGAPVHVTSSSEGVAGLAWTSDGRELLYSTAELEDSEVWRVSATGGTPSRVTGLGKGAQDLSISRDGTRVAFARISIESDIFRMDLDPGAPNRFLPPKPFAPSTRIDGGGRFSPDGQRVAFRSQRSGFYEIWSCSSSGDTPMALTSFNGPDVGAPAWSPDGTELTFAANIKGRSQIYLIASGGGRPRLIFEDDADAQLPEWSPDGRWIYFTSRRTGIYEVWRVPAAGGRPEQVTTGGGSSAQFVEDDLYYAKDFGTLTTLWKLAGGTSVPTRLLDSPVLYNGWDATARGVYYASPGDPPEMRLFDPSTGKSTPISVLGASRPNQLISHVDVSADYRSILFTDRVRLDSDLMLVEGFR